MIVSKEHDYYSTLEHSDESRNHVLWLSSLPYYMYAVESLVIVLILVVSVLRRYFTGKSPFMYIEMHNGRSDSEKKSLCH